MVLVLERQRYSDALWFDSIEYEFFGLISSIMMVNTRVEYKLMTSQRRDQIIDYFKHINN